MPLVAAAVCPHPPALVPGVAPAFDAELAELRAACAVAVGALLSAAPALVVVGGDTVTKRLEPPYRGSFAPWGEPVPVAVGGAAGPGPSPGGAGAPRGPDGPGGPGSPGGTGSPGPARPGPNRADLPLSLLVGGWLLSRPDVDPDRVRMLAVATDAAPAECARLGAELAGHDPVALLVMGDGTARRGEKAPGYADPRAEAFDAAVAGALAAGDPHALAALDPTRAAELLVAGRAPWQVLAGAALATRPDGGPWRPWRATLHFADAPYGVGYTVASWA